ncbi:MAG TPA: hypothetical protein VGG05_25255 [Pseudonocardiaceae bacterium]|jgi:hypothetical protein
MDVDPGAPIDLLAVRRQAVMQWELVAAGTDDWAHIQVGTLAPGGWYVDHTGFGTRRFATKQAAWAAVRRLAGRHDGDWKRVACDSGPRQRVRPADGARILFTGSENYSLYHCWGRDKELIWRRYEAAITADGTLLRSTDNDSSTDQGGYELREYTDPFDGSTRYALSDMGYHDFRMTDYPDRATAESRYETAVRGGDPLGR